MSTELTNDITISLDDITVEEVKSTDTITTSSLTVDTQAPETTVEATKKEYSIVGDGIYASVSTEDAPVWLISIVESVVNNAVANGMTDYDLLVQDVRNAIDSIDIAQNTYVQQVNFDSLVNGLIGSQLETLNATIGNTYATKTELSTVVATTDAALAQNVTDLTASFTSEINSRITAVETAYSDADQAIASDVTALTAAYANQASDIEGAASAITGLQTYVGVDENNIPNSTGVLSRLSILEAQNDGVVEVITGTHDVMLGIEDPNTDTSNDGLDVTAEPYATWIAADTAAGNEEVRASHIGDVYIKYDPVGNTYLASYKFIKTVIDTTDPYATDAKGYTWAIVSDSEAASVYILALNAYDLADGKRRIFVAQPTSGPYDVGDLWLVAVGDAIIGQTINGRVVQAGDILRAAVAKTDQGAYSISHWAFASNYTNDQYAIDIENGTRQIDLGDHVNSLGWTDDSTVDNFITVTYAQDRIDIGEQIDGKATTYFQGTEPYAFDDLSEVERQANEGDVWYDTTPVSGIEAYRFSATTGWELIRDTQTLQALADASTAQATADGRIRNFTQQPFAPYSVGDTWMQGATGDIFVCNTDNLDGAFNQAHWVLASNYTDDTAVTELSNGLADGTVVINLSSATVDGVTSIADFVGGELDNQVVVYSGTDVASAPTDVNDNDLFIESKEVTSGTTTYTETTIYKWDASLVPPQWVSQTNASASIADLADLADGKRTIYSNPSDDVPVGETNDLWFPTTGGNDQTYIPGEVYQYDGTSWELATTYSENLQDFVDTVVNTIVPSLESQIDGKIEYWFTTSDNDPSDNWAEDRYGDIWYQTDTNLSYYYTDVGGVGTWVAISDADALAAIEAAADAQGAADGRVSQFYAWGGSEAPADYVVGGNTIPASNYAYWYKTDGNLYYKPDTVWVTVPITASQTGTTYLSLGDLLTVFDPTELDYTYYYFNGTAWQQNGPSGIISNSKFFVDLDAAVNGPNGIAQAQSDLEISVDTYARSLDNATLSGLSAVDVGWTTDETATAVESDASPIAGCQLALTYAQAVAYAQSIGLRLPTVAEIQSGLGKGTGCGFDNEFIWTSNKGITEGTYYVIKGNYTSTNDIEERSATSTAYIRLAADSHDKLTSASLFAQSKFEYNAPVTINGVTRNAGFGLVNERSSVLNKPLAGFSEFWVAADKFKIVNPNDTSKYAVFSTNLDGSLSLGTNFTDATRNVPAGTYSSTTTYQQGDIVTYNNSSYVALISTNAIPSNDGVNWQLLAAQGVSPLLYEWAGATAWPYNTTETGAISYTFDSIFSGNVVIRVKAIDAEGSSTNGVRIKFNDSDEIPFFRTLGDNTEEWYEFTFDNLLVGTNTIKFWSTTVDGGQIREIQAAFVGAQGLAGAYTDFLFTRSVNTPADPGGANTWYTDVNSVPAGAGDLWSIKKVVSAGGVSTVYSDKRVIDAPIIRELTLYSNVVTSVPTVPASSTFDFTNNTLTINDVNWGINIPSNVNSGDKVYVTTALVTGNNTQSSVAVSWNTPSLYISRVDGISYTGTTEYYKLTNSTTPPLVTNTGWETTPQSPTSDNQYLWNYNKNTKSDGSYTNSAVSLITQYVSDGRGIVSIEEAYQIGDSPTVVPTSTWSDTIADAGSITATNPYLWNRTTITYTQEPLESVVYTLIAARGTDGNNVVVETNPDGSYTLTDGSGVSVTVQDGAPAAAPSITNNNDGTFTIDNHDGDVVTITAGRQITVQGTHLNNNLDEYINISGHDLIPVTGRGHRLVVFNPATQVIEHNQTYDTYGTPSSATTIANIINDLVNGRVVILSTYDASSCNEDLRNALLECGSPLTDTWTASRTAHAFIGTKGAGVNSSYEQVTADVDKVAFVTATFTEAGVLPKGYTPINGVDYFDGTDGGFVSFIYKVGRTVSAPTGGTFDGTSETFPTGWSDTPTANLEDTEWVSTTRYSSTREADGSITWSNSGWSTPTRFYQRGVDGVSFTGTTEYYKITSSTTQPVIDDSWSTTPPTPTSSLPYLWNYNKTTKSDSTFTNSTPMILTTYVSDGAPGNGISSIEEYYQVSSSATTAPTGTWSDTVAGAGELTDTTPYLWNKTVINYTLSASEVTYSLIAVKGTDGNVNNHLGLQLTSNMSIDSTGNKISKTSNNGAWDGEVRSTIAYTNGASCTVGIGTTGKSFMIGLTSDPITNTSYNTIDYAWYITSGNECRIYENGINKGTYSTSYAVGDLLQVVYDGYTVKYYHNGEEKRSVEVETGLSLSFDSSFYHTGNNITSTISFTPVGTSGSYGAGFYRYGTADGVWPGTTSTTNDYFRLASNGRRPVSDDVFTIYKIDDVTVSSTRRYDGDSKSWVAAALTVDGDMIATGTITAPKLKAGTITADRLSISTAGNILDDVGLNSGLITVGTYTTNTNVDNETTVSVRAAGLSWAGVSSNTLEVRQNGTTVDDYNIYYKPAVGSGNTTGYPAQVGNWYEGSVYASTHRCGGSLLLVFRDLAKAWLGSVSVALNNNDLASSTNPDEWTRYHVKGQAPAGTVAVQMVVIKNGTNPGSSNSYIFLHKPQIVETTEYAVGPTPWSTGGQTVISGDTITTGTLDANIVDVVNLNADNITAGKITTDLLKIDDVTLDTDGSGFLTISNGGVGSEQLALYAATVPNSAQGTAGGLSITSFTTPSTIGSISFTATAGVATHITFGIIADGDGSAMVDYTLLRNGTVLTTWRTGSPDRVGNMLVHTDQNTPSGFVTYTVTALRVSGFNSTSLYDWGFLCHQFKR